MSELRQKVIVYTDGAASPNPGAGGYGVILLAGGHRRELAAGFERTTNNRMEILSVIVALESLKKPCDVTIYSDSSYVVNAVMQKWIVKWKRLNGWKNKKERAMNWDLWLRYFTAAEPHKVTLNWIRGHTGIPENERADELAVAAREQEGNPADEGYIASQIDEPSPDLFGT